MARLLRRPGGDQHSASQQAADGPGAPWPPQPPHGHGYGHGQGFGYGDHPPPGGAHPPMQPYYPVADTQPGYGSYGNQQLITPQQWHGDPQPYETAYHQGYADTDPGPFRGGQGHHHQHHGYADSEMEFGDGYYEDEEPRRGRRWLLIAVALVGAIGVGGALAYTYRSLVAPKSRIVASKSEPVKVKIGSDAPERPPVKLEAPPPKVSADADDPPSGSGETQGPRSVKVIPIVPGGASTAPPVSVTRPSPIPGITLYQGPETAPPPVAKEPPEAKEPPQVKEPPPPAAEKKEPLRRVTLGTPPVAKEVPRKDEKDDSDEESVAPPPISKKAPSQVAVATSKAPPPAPKSTGSGMYVAVVKSEKSSMEAMKTYADLQQTYPEVLSGKSFEVQEVDLSARKLGTMYRVLVGPPGSHNWASNVCAQLKAAGYVGCWVKEY